MAERESHLSALLAKEKEQNGTLKDMIWQRRKYVDYEMKRTYGIVKFRLKHLKQIPHAYQRCENVRSKCFAILDNQALTDHQKYNMFVKTYKQKMVLECDKSVTQWGER